MGLLLNFYPQSHLKKKQKVRFQGEFEQKPLIIEQPFSKNVTFLCGEHNQKVRVYS